MENKKYLVCRDNIYVGEVVKAYNINRYEVDVDLLEKKSRQLDTDFWVSYRSMLFVTTDNRLSNDLLYNSPNYPILNVTDDDFCLNLEKNSIVIRNACNLAILLQYFGYKEELTYEDIMKIRKIFFTGRFAKDYCELFGYRETMAEDLTFYNNGQVVTNTKELEKLRRKFRRDQQLGHRSFSGVSEGSLPREYFRILDDRGDNSLMDVINGFDERINAFKPHKQENLVRKLKRV